MNDVALIDMDGTIADYAGALSRDMARLSSPWEAYPTEAALGAMEKHDYLKARMDMIKRTPDWWLNLDPLESGFKVVRMLRQMDYRLHILTKGPKTNTSAWTQKLQWCLKWVPDADVTITHDKGLVYGRVLVDDWPPYVESWLAHRPRGLVIMPDQPWNKDFTHTQVIRLMQDGSSDDKVFENLTYQRKFPKE